MTWKRIKQSIRDNWQLYLLVLPAVVYVFVLNYIPMFGVQIAFKDFRSSKGIWGSPWIGLENFNRFVSFPNFWKIVVNTLSITLYSLATFPIAVIVALQLNELRNEKYKKTVQMVSYAPHFISTVVICAMVRLFFDRGNGIVNHMIEALGGERVSFLSEPKYFSSLYVWSGVWQSVGWNTIIYLSALSGISTDLYEAAEIDGANRLQVIWNINIPSIMPTVLTLFILNCGSLMNLGFEKVYLLQNPLNLDASEVISTYVYEIGLLNGKYSYSSSIGFFNNIVNILLMLLVNMLSKKIANVNVI